MKPVWDNEEYKNYITLNGRIIYDSGPNSTRLEAVKLLNELYNIDKQLRISLANSQDYGIQLYLKTPMIIRELDPNIKEFKGLNKPKDKYMDTVPYGPDGHIRAKWKMLFMKLRSHGGDQLFHNGNRDYIYRLFLHEIAHTMANTVIYSPRDERIHNKLWNDYRIMLIKWAQKRGLVKDGLYDV